MRQPRQQRRRRASQAGGEPTRVALVHLGCARNLIDSELILARLGEAGVLVTGDPDEADVVVVNTCSFIGPAREESDQAIRAQLRAKSAGRLGAVVVAGCLVQRYRRDLVRRYPDVDLFAEISDYSALAKHVAQLGRGQRGPAYLEAPGLRGDEREDARLLATPGSYAYLRISHGCDHQCSFCAIPAIRGPHRSKRLENVAAEARELIDAGVKELVLVAEDSTAWGRDMGLELPDLVEALAELPGDHRVRVMYAYPNRFPWRLAELMREHPRVLPYLDIPIQHIATPVLRAMRRNGSGDQVRRTLERLRNDVPGITLRTTVLLGFPGETDADAEELARFVEEFELGRLGAFTYSPEEGTSGFELDHDVAPEAAEARRMLVLEARDRVLARSQTALVGQTLEVLVDEVHPGRPADRRGPAQEARAVARTDSDAPEVDLIVHLSPISGRLAVGQRVPVRITAVDEESNLVAEETQEAASR